MSTPTPSPEPSPILRQRQARRFLDENTTNWDWEESSNADDNYLVAVAYFESLEGKPATIEAPDIIELAKKVSEKLNKPIT